MKYLILIITGFLFTSFYSFATYVADSPGVSHPTHTTLTFENFTPVDNEISFTTTSGRFSRGSKTTPNIKQNQLVQLLWIDTSGHPAQWGSWAQVKINGLKPLRIFLDSGFNFFSVARYMEFRHGSEDWTHLTKTEEEDNRYNVISKSQSKVLTDKSVYTVEIKKKVFNDDNIKKTNVGEIVITKTKNA